MHKKVLLGTESKQQGKLLILEVVINKGLLEAHSGSYEKNTNICVPIPSVLMRVLGVTCNKSR